MPGEMYRYGSDPIMLAIKKNAWQKEILIKI
jgi:hypothetical protein